MTFARRVLAERKQGGVFASQKEFCLRLHPQPKELETLIRAGALDGLEDGWTRPERMRAAALWRRYRSAHSKKGKVTLFGTESQVSARCWRPPPPSPEYDRRTQLLQEWETLGFLISAHPLSLYAEAIRKAGVIPARDLAAHLGRRVRLVGWQVTQKSVRTKDGQAMMFLSFEDTSALWEGVLWPRQWKRLAPWTLTRGPYLVEGVPREEHGVITVEVQDMRLINPKQNNRQKPPG